MKTWSISFQSKSAAYAENFVRSLRYAVIVFAEALRSRNACKNCRLAFSTGPRGAAFFLCAILFSLRAGMMLAVDRLQPIQRDVGINLCRRNVGMAEQGLDGTQV